MTKGFTHLPALPMLWLPLSPQPCSLQPQHTMLPMSSQPILGILLQPITSINWFYICYYSTRGLGAASGPAGASLQV